MCQYTLNSFPSPPAFLPCPLLPLANPLPSPRQSPLLILCHMQANTLSLSYLFSISFSPLKIHFLVSLYVKFTHRHMKSKSVLYLFTYSFLVYSVFLHASWFHFLYLFLFCVQGTIPSNGFLTASWSMCCSTLFLVPLLSGVPSCTQPLWVLCPSPPAFCFLAHVLHYPLS